MFVPGPTTIDQKTMRTTLRKSMLRAAILHECQNYLGDGGGLGGSEKNIFLAPPSPPRAIIPDARHLGTFENQHTLDGKTQYI